MADRLTKTALRGMDDDELERRKAELHRDLDAIQKQKDIIGEEQNRRATAAAMARLEAEMARLRGDGDVTVAASIAGAEGAPTSDDEEED